MVRVVRFYRHGGPEVLRIEEINTQAPGPGEVQIRVKAFGLNRADVLMRSGNYIERPTLPSGLGLEASGTVETVGEGIDGLAPGDAVSVVPSVSMSRWPAYGELATFPGALVVKHPPAFGWVEAAAIWMPFVTAYGALIDVAKLRRGDFIAITAASSSVGLAAIQIANKIGAIPIAITRTHAKGEALIKAGAAFVIAYEEEDLAVKLTEFSNLGGVRVVFDPIGGPIFESLTAAMSRGGILIEYGGLSSTPTPFPLFTVLSKCLTLRGYLMHEVINDPVRLAAAKTFILDGLESGSFRPTIARTFSFEQIVEAHRFLESNEQFGKIVVTL